MTELSSRTTVAPQSGVSPAAPLLQILATNWRRLVSAFMHTKRLPPCLNPVNSGSRQRLGMDTNPVAWPDSHAGGLSGWSLVVSTSILTQRWSSLVDSQSVFFLAFPILSHVPSSVQCNIQLGQFENHPCMLHITDPVSYSWQVAPLAGTGPMNLSMLHWPVLGWATAKW